MSSMREDVAEALVASTSVGETEAEAHFVFSEGLDLFAGHFPQRPVLPGILEIEMARVTCERALGTRLDVVSVTKAKFLKEVSPGSRIDVSAALVHDGVIVKARVHERVGEDRVSDLRLVLKRRDGARETSPESGGSLPTS
jgi:3-hydroxymyristoyl/3-hydroxydecanoyl-(acyl carrier protein) dehydratase